MSSKRPRWLSTCYHPLLIGSVIFLSILYKIFPSVFALLVKSFPVVICTVLLLVILLNYGEANVPRTREDVGGRNTINNQDKASSAVNRRKASGEVELRDKKDVRVVAEMNNVAQQPGATSETSSCLVNETKDTCHAVADGNELVESNADHDRVYENCFDSTDSNSSCHYHAHHRRASVKFENNGDESSEASEADVMPLLDELAPLLDPEANQAALAASNSSDVGSREIDSNEDSMAEEAGIQDDEDDDETHEEKEDEGKVAVTWTADDQSNLMHLGNSELERNRRLESLIAKRRSRKIPQYRMEKNLIDLDGLDSLPSMEEISRLNAQLSTIYAPRKNPFDLPYDADDTIPGSAPSILLQRQNPFYQAQVQGIGSIGNLGSQDVLTPPSRDPLFRRHESFTIGASLFGNVDEDIFDYRFKPYFSTEREEDERMFSELHRQLSDTSDSKGSSDSDQGHQEKSKSEPKFVAEYIDQANKSPKEDKSTDDENIVDDINVGRDHETHADNDTSEKQTHQSAQVLGPAEDETSEESKVDFGNVELLGVDHEASADKNLSVEQTHQSSQILGAVADEISEVMEADSIVSEAGDAKVLDDDDHETHADKDISVEPTHQSAQVHEAVKAESRDDMKGDSIVSYAENVKVLDGDYETHADKDISVEQGHQSVQALGAAQETSVGQRVDSIVSYAEDVVLDDDHETDADKDLPVVEQTHQYAEIPGPAEDGIRTGVEVDSLVSDAENVEVLGKDKESNSPSSSENIAASETEEQPIEKEKMDEVFSQGVVDSVKEAIEESENINGELEQVLPVYDSSPSATEKSKSIFLTVLDETLLSTDKDDLALDNSSSVDAEEFSSGDRSLPRTSEGLAVVQDPTVTEIL